MGKIAFVLEFEKEMPRNRVAETMRRAGTGKGRIFKDKRLKRQDRKSWRKEHGL